MDMRTILTIGEAPERDLEQTFLRKGGLCWYRRDFPRHGRGDGRLEAYR